MTRRPRVVAAALLLLTFLVGGLAGMATEEALGIDWFDFLDADSRSEERGMLADLGLSDAQRASVDEILERRAARLEAYWESRLPEMRTLVAESYDQIRAVLDEPPRDRFDARIRRQGVPLPQEPD